ncbi:MAG: hypothetical protein COX70_03890 [Flavobacteriales bacterium CG_4_10_14_0_2_um_filter_32_8]|nr:MAG: hypothetical protein COX70_03890 [Flavobacteriales bacterium CG_4_10_14_0_2_um_filter_32_8]PJB16459.1 MAG: hypothetical protein CO118_00435 [Flavobacteriales bacterium CG_4_9_14_3_um_filter_32_8]
MKKTLLSLIAILAVNFAIAQNCTPDPQYTAPGVYPDSATGLPPAYVGVPYDVTITEVVPVDTCIVLIFPPCTVIPIDSVVIDNFTGLPAGFTVVAENQSNLNFTFLGGTTSCMRITGTAIAGQEGVYPLTVSGLSWATVFSVPTSQPFSVNYYSIEILNPSGINSFTGENLQVNQNTPNPFFNSSSIEYYLPTAENVNITINDVVGKVIRNQKISGKKGSNNYTLTASDFSNGVYFFSLTYLNQTITKKFVVNK